jgi:hypothetical protein
MKIYQETRREGERVSNIDWQYPPITGQRRKKDGNILPRHNRRH